VRYVKLRVRLLALLPVLLAACTPQAAPTVITFPLDQARLHNPVMLEANAEVQWLVDGQLSTSGPSRHWSGSLLPGEHTFEIQSDSLPARLRITVLDDAPLGEIRTLTADTSGTIKLGPGTYDLVLGNLGVQTTGTLDLHSQALTTSPNNSRQHASWETQLDSRIHKLLEHRQRPAGTATGHGQVKTQSLTPPAEQRSFLVPNLQDSGSSTIQATLSYASDTVAAYTEDGTPADQAVLDAISHIAQTFGNRLLPLEVRLFGKASDVDANGRVLLLFTPRLNGSQLAVGFFNPSDLLAPSPENPATNQTELLYLGIPNETDVNFNSSSLTATACHEFQHLINFSHKTLPHLADAQPPIEDLAVNEGLSHLAEDLCGYNTLGGNIAFIARFLERAPQTSLDGTDLTGGSDSVERRGAMYTFLRRQYERQPNPAAWLHHLLDSTDTGLGNIAATTDMSPDSLLNDWWWTLSLAGRNGPNDRRYQPLMPVPETGDQTGVDLTAGPVALTGGKQVALNGVAALNAWPAALPAQGFAYRRVNGPMTMTPPAGLTLQVMRRQ
jgi:hypothetical protein